MKLNRKDYLKLYKASDILSSFIDSVEGCRLFDKRELIDLYKAFNLVDEVEQKIEQLTSEAA